MTSTLRTAVVGLAVVALGTVALLLLLNVGGWRARIQARLTTGWQPSRGGRRTAALSTGGSSRIHGVVFARGFEQPRWLAVAPDGDVFVADSAAGKVIVLRDPQAQSEYCFSDSVCRSPQPAVRDCLPR